MRVSPALLLLPAAALAQFRSTVPLVVAPITVTDAQGHYIDGLTEDDLLLSDNNVLQRIRLDYDPYPISLVVAVENGAKSEPAINKLGGSGILFANLVAAYGGETALLTFADEVTLRHDFTGDADAIAKPLRNLHVEGVGACTIDAIQKAMTMLAERPKERRRILFIVAESRDRSSATKLDDAIRAVQRENATVYWLTYSAALMPYTMKPKTVHSIHPEEDGKLIENDVQPAEWDFMGALHELINLKAPNIADLFSRVTGAHTMNFLRKSALEDEIHSLGEEIHRQYIVSFQPPSSEPGAFHTIRVAVKGHPEWITKTRQGYWAVD